MHQPVQDGIGQRVITHTAVPFIRWQLAYHYRGISTVTIVHQLQKIVALCREQRLQPPVNQDKQLCFRQLCKLLPVAAIRPAVRQFNQQPAQSPVLHAVALLAGIVAQRTSHVGFTAATGAGYQQILTPEHPLVLA